jgi:hypothetical protein
VLPRVGVLLGRVALHGAALAKNNTATLLFGGSGAGKSTVSAALASRFGWDVLSDDISTLQSEGRAAVAPSATGVCLWPDACAALELPADRCRSLPAYGGKIWFDLGQDAPRAPQPLRAIVALARSEGAAKPELEPLAPGEGLALTIRQLIRFNPAGGPARELELVQRLRDAIQGVPAFRLVYPSDFAALPRVAARLDTLVT